MLIRSGCRAVAIKFRMVGPVSESRYAAMATKIVDSSLSCASLDTTGSGGGPYEAMSVVSGTSCDIRWLLLLLAIAGATPFRSHGTVRRPYNQTVTARRGRRRLGCTECSTPSDRKTTRRFAYGATSVYWAGHSSVVAPSSSGWWYSRKQPPSVGTVQSASVT